MVQYEQFDPNYLCLQFRLFLIIRLLFLTAAKGNKDHTKQDIGKVGGPEGEQVERLVAVQNPTSYLLVIVGFIDGVDRHIT